MPGGVRAPSGALAACKDTSKQAASVNARFVPEEGLGRRTGRVLRAKLHYRSASSYFELNCQPCNYGVAERRVPDARLTCAELPFPRHLLSGPRRWHPPPPTYNYLYRLAEVSPVALGPALTPERVSPARWYAIAASTYR